MAHAGLLGAVATADAKLFEISSATVDSAAAPLVLWRQLSYQHLIAEFVVPTFAFAIVLLSAVFDTGTVTLLHLSRHNVKSKATPQMCG